MTAFFVVLIKLKIQTDIYSVYELLSSAFSLLS